MSDNILITCLDDIGAHIAKHVEEHNTSVISTPVLIDTIPSNEYSDQASSMFEKRRAEITRLLGDISTELTVEKEEPYDDMFKSVYTDMYETPVCSPSISDDDSGEYNDYFDEASIEQLSLTFREPSSVYDTLDNIYLFKKHVIDSISSKYLNIGLLYLCRINILQDSIYKYIIGFTRNLENVLETIDDTYACEWKMEILALVESKTQNDEVMIKYELLRKGVNIDNNLYSVNKKVYDHVKFMAVYVNPFYIIDDSNDETYLGKKITHKEHTSEHIE